MNYKRLSLLTFSILTLFMFAACTSAEQPGLEDSDPLLYAQGLECDMLMSESEQKICEERVNDFIGSMIENEIIERFDIDRCKELRDKVGINCQTQLANSPVDGPVSDQELEIFNEAIRGSIEEDNGESIILAPTFDIALCEQLTTPGYKEYCEQRVQVQIDQFKLDDILTSQDESRCAELSGEIETQCLEFFSGPQERDIPGPGNVPMPEPVMNPELTSPPAGVMN